MINCHTLSKRGLALMLGLFGVSCITMADRIPSLAEFFAEDFLIGTALAGGTNKGDPLGNHRKERAIIEREFNVLTAENCMKPMYMRPAPGEFYFESTDLFMEFAQENEMEVVGHTLVWHHQTPSWFFSDSEGNQLDREALIERMRHHIHTIVGRYKGKILYWDVVNEVVDIKPIPEAEQLVDDSGKRVTHQAVLRDSKWLEIIGPDYIELAYRFAHEADPETRLLYNDFSLTDPIKVDFVAMMVRHLKSKGIPIHGVGLQAHWHTGHPTLAEIAYAIDTLAATGVQISLTELDMSVLPVAQEHAGADLSDLKEYVDELNPYVEHVPDQILQLQADRFVQIFKLLLDRREVVERVTFWGVADGHSWKNFYPVAGRTDYPLLYDRSYQPKPAYHSIKELKAHHEYVHTH